MLFVILVLYVIGIAFILLSVFGSKTEGLSTKHTLYTIGSAIITIAIFISIGYAIQYLTAALYGLYGEDDLWRVVPERLTCVDFDKVIIAFGT